ncbi:MAG: hypothetical protein P1Q69_13205 [Candidatus Thorarchaeota archaeon]|nr:hypothetical protein [Candidatus Thorarchaeota archaeon]
MVAWFGYFSRVTYACCWDLGTSIHRISIRIALLIFSFTLILMGGTRIIKGVKYHSIERWNRILNVVVGSAVILLSSTVFLLPSLGDVLLLRILTFSIMMIGILRIWLSFTRKEIPAWARAAQFIVGVILLGLGSIIFIVPIAEFDLLVYLMSAAILSNGAIRIVNGLTGKIR